MTIQYFDLFSGVDGWAVGLDRAGRELGIDFECVGCSEIDKFAIQTHEKNFPGVFNYGDITKIKSSSLPEFELLVGSPPCQSFSFAGDRQGIDDPRGQLFLVALGVLRDTRPKHFIFENVPGLLADNSGKSFAQIIGICTELGYCVEWQVLDSSDYGIPQSRRRIFIVGHLGGLPGRPVFPMGSAVGRKVQGDPPRARYDDDLLAGGPFPDREPFLVVRDKGRSGEPVFREVFIPTTIDAHYGNGLGNQGTRTGVAVIEDGRLKVRRFTPLECERIMGYPDGWTEGVSESQRYKQMGNGICPDLVARVAGEIYRGLTPNEEDARINAS